MLNKVILGGIFSLLLLLNACSSSQRHETAETQEDKVVARMNEESSRPKWLDESKPFQIKDGQIIALGQTTIPGDNRVEAAYRIAQNNAKAGICSNIEQRLSFIFQQATEGTTEESTQARYIGAEACELTTSAIRPGRAYWEKVATTRDSGERVTQFKVFATVTMPEQDLKKAIIDAARKREGKGGLSENFSNKVEQHWDKFVKGDPKPEGGHE